jgi:hypothetical protein
MAAASVSLSAPNESINLFKTKFNDSNAICQAVSKEAGQLISICPDYVQ